MSRKREWQIRGWHGAAPISVRIKARSHADARREAASQGIGPTSIVLIDREPPRVMRQKAIRAFAELMQSA